MQKLERKQKRETRTLYIYTQLALAGFRVRALRLQLAHTGTALKHGFQLLLQGRMQGRR